jgi:hypothetical protein
MYLLTQADGWVDGQVEQRSGNRNQVPCRGAKGTSRGQVTSGTSFAGNNTVKHCQRDKIASGGWPWSGPAWT